MDLLLVTQYVRALIRPLGVTPGLRSFFVQFDTVKEIGSHSSGNTLFLPHSPGM